MVVLRLENQVLKLDGNLRIYCLVAKVTILTLRLWLALKPRIPFIKSQRERELAVWLASVRVLVVHCMWWRRCDQRYLVVAAVEYVPVLDALYWCKLIIVENHHTWGANCGCMMIVRRMIFCTLDIAVLSAFCLINCFDIEGTFLYVKVVEWGIFLFSHKHAWQRLNAWIAIHGKVVFCCALYLWIRSKTATFICSKFEITSLALCKHSWIHEVI